MPSKPKTVDEYLATLSDERRASLETLRRVIRDAAPRAEECIRYGVPAFRQKGMLVGFGASATHCSFYLMSTATLEAHRKELAGFETGKGTVRFQPGRPLPEALVKKLVRARIAENEG